MGGVLSVLRYHFGRSEGVRHDLEANAEGCLENGPRQASNEQENNQLMIVGQGMEESHENREKREQQIAVHRMRLKAQASAASRRLLQWLTLRKQKSPATQEKLFRAFSQYKTFMNSVNDLAQDFSTDSRHDQVIDMDNSEQENDNLDQFPDSLTDSESIISPPSTYFFVSDETEAPSSSMQSHIELDRDNMDVAEDSGNDSQNLGSADTPDRSGQQISETNNAEEGRKRSSKRGKAAKALHGLDKATSDEKKGKFACICGVICITMKAHKRHVEYKTNVGNFKCRHCEKSYLYFGHLTQHERQAHNVVYLNNNKELGSEFGCRKCGLVLFNLADLLSHQKLAHSNYSRPNENSGSSNGLSSVRRSKRTADGSGGQTEAITATSAEMVQDAEVGTSTSTF